MPTGPSRCPSVVAMIDHNEACARFHCRSYGMAILFLMARMTVRSTFALDIDTADSLERLARQWGVSKSEALRRAIAAAAVIEAADPASDALNALDALQERLALDRDKAERWIECIRAEREASGP